MGVCLMRLHEPSAVSMVLMRVSNDPAMLLDSVPFSCTSGGDEQVQAITAQQSQQIPQQARDQKRASRSVLLKASHQSIGGTCARRMMDVIFRAAFFGFDRAATQHIMSACGSRPCMALRSCTAAIEHRPHEDVVEYQQPGPGSSAAAQSTVDKDTMQ